MLTKKEFKEIILKKLKEKNFIIKNIKVIVKDDSRYANFYNAFVYLKNTYENPLVADALKDKGYNFKSNYSAVLECYKEDRKTLENYWNAEIETIAYEASKANPAAFSGFKKYIKS